MSVAGEACVTTSPLKAGQGQGRFLPWQYLQWLRVRSSCDGRRADRICASARTPAGGTGRRRKRRCGRTARKKKQSWTGRKARADGARAVARVHIHTDTSEQPVPRLYARGGLIALPRRDRRESGVKVAEDGGEGGKVRLGQPLSERPLLLLPLALLVTNSGGRHVRRPRAVGGAPRGNARRLAPEGNLHHPHRSLQPTAANPRERNSHTIVGVPALV